MKKYSIAVAIAIALVFTATTVFAQQQTAVVGTWTGNGPVKVTIEAAKPVARKVVPRRTPAPRPLPMFRLDPTDIGRIVDSVKTILPPVQEILPQEPVIVRVPADDSETQRKLDQALALLNGLNEDVKRTENRLEILQSMAGPGRIEVLQGTLNAGKRQGSWPVRFLKAINPISVENARTLIYTFGASLAANYVSNQQIIHHIDGMRSEMRSSFKTVNQKLDIMAPGVTGMADSLNQLLAGQELIKKMVANVGDQVGNVDQHVGKGVTDILNSQATTNDLMGKSFTALDQKVGKGVTDILNSQATTNDLINGASQQAEQHFQFLKAGQSLIQDGLDKVLTGLAPFVTCPRPTPFGSPSPCPTGN